MSYSIGYVEDVRKMAQEVHDCEVRIKEEVSNLLAGFQVLDRERKEVLSEIRSEVTRLKNEAGTLLEGFKTEREEASRAWQEIIRSRTKTGKAPARARR